MADYVGLRNNFRGKGVVAMTREELRGIVDGISDEQLKKILDINSADIGKTKKNAEEMKAELEAARCEVEKLTSENSDLRAGQSEAEGMKEKIRELQKVIDDRLAEDEKNAKTAEILNRFEKASGNAEFLNEFTRTGILEQFSKALDNEENVGKSDNEIFEMLTGNMGNIFVADGGVPTVISSTAGFGADLSMGDVREIMGLNRTE